jgi:teichuronic acid biosynthesis glycosyltransferase TuaG
MNSLVSIIMPCYKASKYIKESIESVLNQTYENWELLIIDDCSPDDSLSYIRGMLLDERCKLIELDSNVGAAKARNIGQKEAKGRFVAFLDSDDLWMPRKLEVQIKYMLKNNVGFTYTNYEQFSKNNNNSNIVAPSSINYYDMIKCNFIGCLTVVYDTSFFGKFYFPLTKKRHDFALWLLMLRRFDRACNVEDTLARYRVHDNSLSSKKSDAFQSYYYVLRELEGQGRIKSFVYTLNFSILSIIKKKSPAIYKFLYSIYLSKNNGSSGGIKK